MASWDQYKYSSEPQKSFWRRALPKALLGALLTSLFFTLLLLLPLFLIEEPLLFSSWEPSLFSVPFLASIYGPLALCGAVVGKLLHRARRALQQAGDQTSGAAHLDEVQIDLAERDQTRDTDSCSTPMYPGPIYTWGCYPCEYAGDAVMNPVLSHYTTDSTECGSADSDWILWFTIDYSNDPDSLRWYTTSSQVYLGLIIYGSSLNSFSYSWIGFSGAQLVVGKTATSLAGGIGKVEDSVYLAVNYP